MLAEFSAFKARLGGHTLLTGKVEPGARLKNGEPVQDNYVIADPSVPFLDDARYLDGPDPEASAQHTFDVRVVATDTDGVLLLMDAAIEQMVGHALIVPGRVCDPVALVPPVEEGRVLFDRTTRLFYMDVSFRFWSRRDVWEDEES